METKVHKNIFFDSEFTNFKDLNPISLGFISENGKDELYLEFNDFKKDSCSDFVKENILTILDGTPKTSHENVIALVSWINQIECHSISFISDYQGDIYILAKLLQNQEIHKTISYKLLEKEFIETAKLRGLYNDKLMPKALTQLVNKQSELFSEQPKKQHHSLFDSQVIRKSWIHALQFLQNH